MRTIWYTVLVLITLASLAIIWEFGSAVAIFLLSLAFAAAIRPMIKLLTKRGVKKALAMVISFGLIVLAIGGLFTISSGPLMTDFQKSGNDLQRNYDWVKNVWMQSDNEVLVNFANQLPSSKEIYTTLTGEASGTVVRSVLGIAEGTFSILAKVFLILVLSIYWAADQVRFERLWLSILPVKSRRRARKGWQALESGVGKYIRKEASFSIITGLLLWLMYLLLGIKYPAMLTIIGMFARLIPLLGPLLVILLPLIFGSNYGFAAVVAAVLFTVLFLVVLDVTLFRRYFPKQQYSSLLLVIIMAALTQTYGVIGAILAPILTIALQILIEQLLKQQIFNESEIDSQSILSLKSKVQLIKEKIDNSGTVVISESSNFITRLDDLITKAEVFEKKQ